MPKKAWNGSGVLTDGVEVKFATRVSTIRRIEKPHPWPPPAADLKREAQLAEAESDTAEESEG